MSSALGEEGRGTDGTDPELDGSWGAKGSSPPASPRALSLVLDGLGESFMGWCVLVLPPSPPYPP